MAPKTKILICGILPPPNFGHSMIYKMLMESSFVQAHDVVFLNLHFWTYGKHKKITADKIFKMVKYLFQYVYLILRHKPRYILFNMSFDRMPFLKDYLFCALGKGLGCKIILHDMGQYLPELYGSSRGMFKCALDHLLSFSTAIIVMGQKVKGEYAQYVDSRRLVVVPGTVEETEQLKLPIERRKDPRQIRILYFSFLSKTKGVWTALSAMKDVVKKNPNCHFTFAGPVESQEMLGAIKNYITQEDLGAHFDYLGYIEGVERRTLCFRHSDIFIFPTLRDVFGLVLLHAMAEGVPIVASREGTIPEIVHDGVNGLLFEKGNEAQLAANILSLANDAPMRARMSNLNRLRYKEYYSPRPYGERMITAFDEIQQIK